MSKELSANEAQEIFGGTIWKKEYEKGLIVEKLTEEDLKEDEKKRREGYVWELRGFWLWEKWVNLKTGAKLSVKKMDELECTPEGKELIKKLAGIEKE